MTHPQMELILKLPLTAGKKSESRRILLQDDTDKTEGVVMGLGGLCWHTIAVIAQGGQHILAQEEESHTPEQLQLMKTQDEKYVHMKLAVERKVMVKLSYFNTA